MRLATAEPTRHTNPTVKAAALAYAIFDRPDLKKAEEYLIDFGLRARVERRPDAVHCAARRRRPFCYVVRKADEPRFVGLGLEVETRADLEALPRLPGASAIEALTWPGGGKVVRLTDPSGFRVDAVFGRAAAPELAASSALADELDRLRGAHQRNAAPALDAARK